ncbi:MAG: M56 family metallopeptidase [Cellulosilyticaceae bacterium]
MGELGETILRLSIAGSVGTLLALGFLRWLKRYGSASRIYWVWLVVLALFMMPVGVQVTIKAEKKYTTASLNRSLKQDITLQQKLKGEGDMAGEIPIISQQAKSSTLKITSIWGIGAAALFVFGMLGYMRTYRQLLKTSEVVIDDKVLAIYRQARQMVGTYKAPALRGTQLVDTPMLIGLIHPVIVVPQNNLQDLDTMKYIFVHELTHFKNHDLWIKWAKFMAMVVHWYNPLIYVVHHFIEQYAELACDEGVIKDLSKAGCKTYMHSILSAIADNLNAYTTLSSCMCKSKKQLQKRFDMMIRVNRKKRTYTMAVLVIASIIGCTSISIAGFTLDQKSPWTFEKNAQKKMINLEENQKMKHLFETELQAYPPYIGQMEQIEEGNTYIYEVQEEVIGGGLYYMITSKYDQNGKLLIRKRYEVSPYTMAYTASGDVTTGVKRWLEEWISTNESCMLLDFEVIEVKEVNDQVEIRMKMEYEDQQSVGVNKASYHIIFEKSSQGDYRQLSSECYYKYTQMK